MQPGLRLRQLRRASRLAQEELAARADVSQSMLSRLEHGQRRGHPETWRRIAAALQVPPEWFGLAG